MKCDLGENRRESIIKCPNGYGQYHSNQRHHNAILHCGDTAAVSVKVSKKMHGLLHIHTFIDYALNANRQFESDT